MKTGTFLNPSKPHFFQSQTAAPFSDDHQLYVTGSDYDIVSSRLQNQGKLAMPWYRDNFLLANTEKFQCLTIKPRNNDSDKETEALQIED